MGPRSLHAPCGALVGVRARCWEIEKVGRAVSAVSCICPAESGSRFTSAYSKTSPTRLP